MEKELKKRPAVSSSGPQDFASKEAEFQEVMEDMDKTIKEKE